MRQCLYRSGAPLLGFPFITKCILVTVVLVLFSGPTWANTPEHLLRLSLEYSRRCACCHAALMVGLNTQGGSRGCSASDVGQGVPPEAFTLIQVNQRNTAPWQSPVKNTLGRRVHVCQAAEVSTSSQSWGEPTIQSGFKTCWQLNQGERSKLMRLHRVLWLEWLCRVLVFHVNDNKLSSPGLGHIDKGPLSVTQSKTASLCYMNLELVLCGFCLFLMLVLF